MSKIIEHDTATGETVLRDMTKDELAQQKIDAANAEELKVKEETAESIKAAQKAPLLAKLGITEDEAKLLLS